MSRNIGIRASTSSLVSMVVETRNQSMANVQKSLEAMRLHKDAQDVRHQEMLVDIAIIKEMLHSFLAQKHPMADPLPEPDQSSSVTPLPDSTQPPDSLDPLRSGILSSGNQQPRAHLQHHFRQFNPTTMSDDLLSQEEETSHLVLQDEPISTKETSVLNAHQLLDEMPKSLVNGELILMDEMAKTNEELVDCFAWEDPPMGSVEEPDDVQVFEEAKLRDVAHKTSIDKLPKEFHQQEVMLNGVVSVIFFDPGGDMLLPREEFAQSEKNEPTTTKEFSYLVARQVFDKIPELEDCHFPELFNEIKVTQMNKDEEQIGSRTFKVNFMKNHLKLVCFDPGGSLLPFDISNRKITEMDVLVRSSSKLQDTKSIYMCTSNSLKWCCSGMNLSFVLKLINMHLLVTTDISCFGRDELIQFVGFNPCYQLLFDPGGELIFIRKAVDLALKLSSSLCGLDNGLDNSASLDMLGEYSQDMTDAPYTLESLIENRKEGHSAEVQLHLQVAAEYEVKVVAEQDAIEVFKEEMTMVYKGIRSFDIGGLVVLRPDMDLKFAVNKIYVNKNGSALLLAGSDGLSVMYLSGRTSTRDNSTICPVDFSFRCDHLWDRFSVFILFSDGSVYVICPVAPFGSVYIWDSVMEIYSDAQAFGLKSSNANAVTNSMLAISWLEATLPGLRQEGKQVANSSAVKAHAYALIDASLLLQGPLRKLCHSGEDQVLYAAECEGHVVSFMYNSIGKDSVLVVAWSGGQLQIDALADEIQPLWNTGSSPRLFVNSHDRIIGYAMICEGFSGQLPFITLDKSIDHSDWLGQPPPLLRLAIVDLALPKSGESDSLITLHADPLVPERTYALHDGGVDSGVDSFGRTGICTGVNWFLTHGFIRYSAGFVFDPGGRHVEPISRVGFTMIMLVFDAYLSLILEDKDLLNKGEVLQGYQYGSWTRFSIVLSLNPVCSGSQILDCT